MGGLGPARPEPGWSGRGPGTASGRGREMSKAEAAGALAERLLAGGKLDPCSRVSSLPLCDPWYWLCSTVPVRFAG